MGSKNWLIPLGPMLDLLLSRDIQAIQNFQVPYRQSNEYTDLIDAWVEEHGTTRGLNYFIDNHPQCELLRIVSANLQNVPLPRGLQYLAYLHRPARNANLTRKYLLAAVRKIGGLQVGIEEVISKYYLERCRSIMVSNGERTRRFYHYINRLYLGSIYDGTAQFYLRLDAVRDIYETTRAVQMDLDFMDDNSQYETSSDESSESGEYPSSMIDI